jgi:hypothetical protein
MQTVKPSYPANTVTITITLASLTNGSIATSSAIDNTANFYGTIGIAGKFKTGASGVSATGTITIAIAASADAGSNYPAFANAQLVTVLQANANATTYVLGWQSVAALFGGVLPSHFEILVQNNTGATLDATAGNHGMWYEAEQDTLTP